MVISRRHLLFCAPAIIAYPKLMKIPHCHISDYFGQGVSLFNTAHPLSNTAEYAADLNEASLLNLMLEIRGYDQYGNRMTEFIQRPLVITRKQIGEDLANPW